MREYSRGVASQFPMQQEPEPEVQVRCHAGFRYPEWPTSFLWEGEERRVAEVEREWKEPGLHAFVVRDEEGERFQLSYADAEARWRARRLPRRG